MTLLKDDGTAPAKPQPKYMIVVNRWPVERQKEGLGLSFLDGFWPVLGGGVALTIVLPIILLVAACLITFGITILGGSLGALL